MIEDKKITVRLGGRDFDICEASYIRSSRWRKTLSEIMEPRLQSALNLKNIEVKELEDLMGLIEPFKWIALNAVDDMFKLIMEYDQGLSDEREYIENHATDTQIIKAFQELLAMTDPFGLVRQLQIGLGTGALGKNLRGLNGASQAKKSKVPAPELSKG